MISTDAVPSLAEGLAVRSTKAYLHLIKSLNSISTERLLEILDERDRILLNEE